jgi:hypothetical protein
MADISGTRVAIVATHGFEQSELEIPRDRLRGRRSILLRSRPDKSADGITRIGVIQFPSIGQLMRSAPATMTRSSCPAARSIPTCCA